MPNTELLNATLDHIEAHLDLWDQHSAGPHCTNKGCTWVICGRCVAVVRPDGKGYPR